MNFFTQLIEDLYQLFNIVGYSEKEQEEKILQFIRIIERDIVEVLHHNLDESGKKQLEEIVERLVATTSADNDIQVIQNNMEIFQKSLANVVMNSPIANNYQQLVKDVSSRNIVDYCNHIASAADEAVSQQILAIQSKYL